MLPEGCSTEGPEGAVKAAPGLESLLITPNSENVDTVTKMADDETQPTLLIPPVSSCQYSSFEALLFNISSSILSPLFLIFCVLVPAILSAIPVLAWAIWSYVQFKDPNRWRPFYEEEKERRYMDTGKIVSDIGYYARRVGLDCEEFKIETEDGYILTMQHLIDKRPGAVPSNRTISPDLTDGQINTLCCACMDCYKLPGRCVLMTIHLSLSSCARAAMMYGWEIIGDISNPSTGF
jgi:Partial alpha/beta-hydrolase lipase region